VSVVRYPTSHKCSRRDAANGFTLLEVLVAFLIAALALAVLFRSEMGSLTSLETASQYEQAVARAQSRLAMAVHGAPLQPGDQQGDDGSGFRWRVRITPVDNIAVPALGMLGPRRPPRISVALYAVSVSVWWTDRGSVANAVREVRLDTQQLAATLP
jgi:general secretion pathway protein I